MGAARHPAYRDTCLGRPPSKIEMQPRDWPGPECRIAIFRASVKNGGTESD